MPNNATPWFIPGVKNKLCIQETHRLEFTKKPKHLFTKLLYEKLPSVCTSPAVHSVACTFCSFILNKYDRISVTLQQAFLSFQREIR